GGAEQSAQPAGRRNRRRRIHEYRAGQQPGRAGDPGDCDGNLSASRGRARCGTTGADEAEEPAANVEESGRAYVRRVEKNSGQQEPGRKSGRSAAAGRTERNPWRDWEANTATAAATTAAAERRGDRKSGTATAGTAYAHAESAGRCAGTRAGRKEESEPDADAAEVKR